MAQGIVVKIWNVKEGSKGRSGSAQMNSSIDYIMNDEKCNAYLGDGTVAQMGRELLYVANDVKTIDGLYVGARLITDVHQAVHEMMRVKEFYGKTDGRVALHGIISVDAEESDPKNAPKLMLLASELMEQIFPQHQVVYAVHCNTDNLHAHFVLNTVGLDGKKIHMDHSFMRKEFEPALNKLARKYGFTPNEEWENPKTIDEISVAERKIMLRKEIDLAIEQTDAFSDFIALLRSQDLQVNVGKNLAIKAEGMSRAMRSGSLGNEYTISAIKERIMTKRDAFIFKQMNAYAKPAQTKEMVNYVPTILKKYKDLTPEKQKEVVGLLREGRNPWRERMMHNWQITRISDEMFNSAHVYDLVAYYAPRTMSIADAMKEIIRVQRQIAEEKKEIRANLRKYKPQIELYEEMKRYQLRAHLYDMADCEEYKEDYEKYKELSKRLWENYEKTIVEVAAFVEEQKNQLLYATEQGKELSDQYKALKRFGEKSIELAERKDASCSLFDAVGYAEAKRQSQIGIYVTRVAYIVSEGKEDGMIRVLTMPGMNGEKAEPVTTISVMDEKGRIIEELSSDQMSAKEFNNRIYELKTQDGYQNCHVFKDERSADSYRKEEKNRLHK